MPDVDFDLYIDVHTDPEDRGTVAVGPSATRLGKRWDGWRDRRTTARRLEAGAGTPTPFSPHWGVTTTPPTWWSSIERLGLWLLVALTALVALALWVVCLALIVWLYASGEYTGSPRGPAILLLPPVGATLLAFLLFTHALE